MILAGPLLWPLLQVAMLASAPATLPASMPPPAVCPVPGSIGRCVFFHFDWPAAEIPKYTVVVQEDHIAHYWEGDGPYDDEQRSKPALHVSDATLQTVFKANISPAGCETHLKKLAQTGKKTLQSFAGDEVVECSFNYSDDATVSRAATVFQAIAETMQFGERLAKLHRFDRLGLDAEIDSLEVEAKAGRAIELGNIAPVLLDIGKDERVMERVRLKAARLLQTAGVPADPVPAPESGPILSPRPSPR